MSTRQEQLDLFVALVGDIPFRDDREAMSAPLVSLAKRSPDYLEWTGPSGQKVEISAKTGGIATIYDFDIVIWGISQINAGIERGRDPVDRHEIDAPAFETDRRHPRRQRLAHLLDEPEEIIRPVDLVDLASARVADHEPRPIDAIRPRIRRAHECFGVVLGAEIRIVAERAAGAFAPSATI